VFRWSTWRLEHLTRVLRIPQMYYPVVPLFLLSTSSMIGRLSALSGLSMRTARLSTSAHAAMRQVRHAVPAVPHLHDLVGDESQPGLSGAHGVKALAIQQVARGQTVFREGGIVYSQPSMHSIQIGPSHHCQIDGEGRFTAHSFTPNCAVIISACAERPIEFVALRTIEVGEQFSFDYTTTEWELQNNGFVDHASGRPVRGFKHLNSEDKRRLLDSGLLPAHIMQLWLTELLSAGSTGKGSPSS
jgi:hypothetical protein